MELSKAFRGINAKIVGEITLLLINPLLNFRQNED